MNIESVQETYRRYAPKYDLLFGAIFHPGRKEVIRQLNCMPGEKILEVGVGTGLSLPLYPQTVEVTGIDISEEMLDRAHQRVERDELENIHLHAMNAQKMDFPDNSFDKVVAMYVASVVPDYVALVNEMRRVCRPGGQLMFVNHFHSSRPIVRWFESSLKPLSAKLGFNPGFSMDAFVEDCRLDITKNQPVNLFGYWRMLQAPASGIETESLEETIELEEVVLKPAKIAAG